MEETWSEHHAMIEYIGRGSFFSSKLLFNLDKLKKNPWHCANRCWAAERGSLSYFRSKNVPSEHSANEECLITLLVYLLPRSGDKIITYVREM